MNSNPAPRASDSTADNPPSSLAARPKLKLFVLGALGLLLVGVLVFAAWLLHRIRWTVPFLHETGLLVWIAALVLALAVTALLAASKFRQAWRRSLTRRAVVHLGKVDL